MKHALLGTLIISGTLGGAFRKINHDFRLCLFESSSTPPYEVVSISIKQYVLKMATEIGNDETMFLQ